MKLAIISSFMALGMVAANQKDTNASRVVVLSVNFALSGFKQTGDTTAAPVRISNKDMFNALNSTGNGSTIGRSARLVLLQDQDGHILGFQTRERGTTNDISGDNISVRSSGNTVRNKNAEYTILTFRFNDGNGNDFSVSGFATIRRGKITGHGVGTISDIRLGAAVQVAGTGDVGGESAVFRGTVSASGARAEASE